MVVTNPLQVGDVLVAVALGWYWILTSQDTQQGKGSLAPTPEGINNVVLL